MAEPRAFPSTWDEQANWSLIPHHCRDGLRAHIVTGRPTGTFLYAVLTNDLRGAHAHADDVNRDRLKDYLQFLYAYAPPGSYGSPEKVAAWQKAGGLRGGAQ